VQRTVAHCVRASPRPERLTTVSTVTGWSDIGRSDDLPELAPEATAALARVLGAIASVDTEGPRSHPVVRRWTEQFVTDVASLDDDLRVAAASALGADLFAYVVAVWADDMAGRLRSAWAQLAGSSPSSGRGVAEPETDGWPAVEQFLVAVSRLDHLDAVTTELVRLRGARANNCRLCRSLRNVHAIGAGADESMFDAIDRYESSDLAEPLKVALCVTDAVLWTPHAWPAGLAADVRRCFSPDQAVELVFDVVRNAANRIAVALGADEAHVADGVEYFAVDADGALTYGLPVPGTSETV
jgi:alkylhydroperoxidase family enzyme